MLRSRCFKRKEAPCLRSLGRNVRPGLGVSWGKEWVGEWNVKSLRRREPHMSTVISEKGRCPIVCREGLQS